MNSFKTLFFSLICLVLLSLSPLSSQAWWDAGHMVTAMIAYQQLEPEVKTKCDDLIQVLSKEYAYTNHFVAAATWPDDLKGEGVHFYDSWHYTNIPYNPSGAKVECIPQVDVVWAIGECTKILSKSSTRPLEKARALAFLIHFVGDIHQPMHSTTMYTPALPEGDQGGNFYMIQESHEKLHSLWDDGCGYTSELNEINPFGQPKEPLSKAHLTEVENFANKVMQAYPPKEQPFYKNLYPNFWAQESHEFAVKFAYHGINGTSDGKPVYLDPWGQPSDLYIKNGQEVVGKRLSLGGYRLAALLNKIMKG